MAGLRIPIQFFGKAFVPVFEVISPCFFHLHHFFSFASFLKRSHQESPGVTRGHQGRPGETGGDS